MTGDSNHLEREGTKLPVMRSVKTVIYSV
jgi:hypothetical protein